jgi:iron complex transport system permease protein
MNRLRWAALGGLTLVALIAGIALGAVRLSPADVAHALVDPGDRNAAIVVHLRLPRVMLAFLVGGTLAVSGAVLQALIRNPLADPYLLGLSGGSALGAVTVIALGIDHALVLPVAAFLGALAAIFLVYRLSVVPGRRLDPGVMLLAGVVVSAFTGAMVSALLVLTDAPRLRNAYLWLLGGFDGASWPSVITFAGYALVPLLVLGVNARSYDLLALGDDTARHLGTDPERLKRIAFFSTGLLTAASVAVCGMIGFVGLVIPHAIRRVWGPLHATLLPTAFLLGGAFLVLADAAARSIAPPIELPVGVITSLVGVPLFAVLLRRTLR